jgi:hypothetical protein
MIAINPMHPLFGERWILLKTLIQSWIHPLATNLIVPPIPFDFTALKV